MSHQNQRGTKISIQIEQQVYYFGARLSIEITGGLIRKQNLRIGRKSARNCHPLLLTAGELSGVMLKAMLQAHSIQQLFSIVLSLGVAPKLARQHDVFKGC